MARREITLMGKRYCLWLLRRLKKKGPDTLGSSKIPQIKKLNRQLRRKKFKCTKSSFKRINKNYKRSIVKCQSSTPISSSRSTFLKIYSGSSVFLALCLDFGLADNIRYNYPRRIIYTQKLFYAV
jgi:hypothetical protein